jgi:predicted PurR-regulated permease PerM
VEFFEKLFSLIFKKKKKNKINRALSILITFSLTIFLLSCLIASIVPELLSSLKNLIVNLPDYFNVIMNYVNRLSEKYPDIVDFAQEKLSGVRDNVFSGLTNLETIINSIFVSKGIVGSITGGALNLINILKNTTIGIIIAFYLLYSKEKFIAQMRKVTFALFNHGHASSLLRLSTEANQIFSNFIVGKAIDSIIIGLLTFIGLALLKMPYVVLISFMVGCTNMIPVFGPFIGAIPSAILILLSSGPNKMIYFCIFIIILQQIDGNIIGPKILGNQLGISAFWIMCSVIIGGGLFGVLGMIIAVPIFAFVHLVVSRIINNKLLQKNLSIDVSDYT